MSFDERPSAEALRSFLEDHPETRYLRYQWLDVGSVLRTIVVTKEFALHHGDGAFKGSAYTMAFFPDDTFNLSRFDPVGYDELYPDWRTLRPCTYLKDATSTASVMCFVKELSRNFPAWRRDPRKILDDVLQRAKKEFGMDFLAGFEIEFHLTDKMNREASQPVDFISQCYSAAALRDDRVLAVLDESMQAIREAGIDATHYHSEYGRGIFEIPLGPLRPIEAVDALLFSKEAIKTVAKRHGFSATCHPKPELLPSTIAVGGHVHFSIDNATQEVADSFLAGILTNTPAICAFTMANLDSYQRLGGYRATIGTWVGWATEDRDVAIRKIADRVGYWELRCADQTANMYYALAAWITAGCSGVKQKMALKWKDPTGKRSQWLSCGRIHNQLT